MDKREITCLLTVEREREIESESESESEQTKRERNYNNLNQAKENVILSEQFIFTIIVINQ